MDSGLDANETTQFFIQNLDFECIKRKQLASNGSQHGLKGISQSPPLNATEKRSMTPSSEAIGRWWGTCWGPDWSMTRGFSSWLVYRAWYQEAISSSVPILASASCSVVVQNPWCCNHGPSSSSWFAPRRVLYSFLLQHCLVVASL